MSLSRFRLITFDVVDTLLQFRTTPGKQYGEIGAMFGVRCDNNELAINFKQNWKKMNRAHPNFGRYSKLGWENWWHELISSTFKESGVKMSEKNMIAFADNLIELYKTSTCWQHCYGAIDLLNYLKLQQQIGSKEINKENNNKSNNNDKLPFVMGVISNFDPRLDTLLRNMKINHYFDFVLTSYECKFEKPCEDIFKYAMKLSEIKDLKPNQCLHIGHTPITDYLGAKNAGWYAALIHEKDPEYLIRKYGEKICEYHCFSSLYDFHKKLSNDFVRW